MTLHTELTNLTIKERGISQYMCADLNNLSINVL